MNSNETIYRKYLDKLKRDIIRSYNESGKRATGKFEQEMESHVDEKKMVLLGPPHSYYMEKGRGPGGWPPLSAIEEWIDKKKGLPVVFREKKKQFVYLISRKIAREGTQGTPVLEPVIQDFMDNDFWTLIDEVGEAYLVQVKNDIVRLIRTLKH